MKETKVYDATGGRQIPLVADKREWCGESKDIAHVQDGIIKTRPCSFATQRFPRYVTNIIQTVPSVTCVGYGNKELSYVNSFLRITKNNLRALQLKKYFYCNISVLHTYCHRYQSCRNLMDNFDNSSPQMTKQITFRLVRSQRLQPQKDIIKS